VTSAPTSSKLAAFAAASCRDAYDGCAEGIITMAGAFPGGLVAICDYSDGTGDVVILEKVDAAEATCSADGLVPGSRVVRVVELP
jgi:hypothetical protein